MDIVCISDLHGTLPDDLPDGDILLIAGDICPINNHNKYYQLYWLDTYFQNWLKHQNKKYKVVAGCAGNHDFVFEHGLDTNLDLPWYYCEDDELPRLPELNGLKIYFSPWQPIFCDWAFNLSEEKLKKTWAMIPDDVDILVTHGPPYRIQDYIPSQKKSVGSTTLYDRVGELMKNQLKLHIFGHIHEGYGQIRINNTIFANVSILDEHYKYTNKPMKFTI